MPTNEGAFIVFGGIAWTCAFVAWWYAFKAWRKKDDGFYVTFTPDSMDFESKLDPRTCKTTIVMTLRKTTSAMDIAPELFSAHLPINKPWKTSEVEANAGRTITEENDDADADE